MIFSSGRQFGVTPTISLTAHSFYNGSWLQKKNNGSTKVRDRFRICDWHERFRATDYSILKRTTWFNRLIYVVWSNELQLCTSGRSCSPCWRRAVPLRCGSYCFPWPSAPSTDSSRATTCCTVPPTAKRGSQTGGWCSVSSSGFCPPHWSPRRVSPALILF